MDPDVDLTVDAEPCTESYRECIGSIMCLMVCTRPDFRLQPGQVCGEADLGALGRCEAHGEVKYLHQELGFELWRERYVTCSHGVCGRRLVW